MYESGEDYLETILVIQKRNGTVRSIDVASELNFSKPSVSRAMGILKKAGYILIDEKGHITFTEKGRSKAEAIYERHNLIAAFLEQVLDVSEENALKDACRIEHDLSDETYEKMREMLDKQD
ncbi:metal-dependent transcriptional regulator [Clostridium aminobutyricum]|uniref:Metal-dependent transcriptional regulator n=1 Tax=Clostridium aminobutyricum TaxID=33953 RepID=A0A939IH49_CLOAM|nr:metal-dependent transcriptional regulator [Clostridium aminobutyricum]